MEHSLEAPGPRHEATYWRDVQESPPSSKALLLAAVRLICAFSALVIVTMVPARAQQAQKPNVVFILADNVGYGDLGSYGGGALRGAPTPRLDQLASEGLRLTQFLVMRETFR